MSGVSSLLSALGSSSSSMKTLAIFTLVIVAYSVFIFYFYRFLARKNIINLDLSKYNKYQFGGIYRFFAIIFFIIEYIIILPFITFFWFGVLAILILLLAELELELILIVSAVLIGAIRITSFISEDLSRDLAKMIPLAFLALALTSSTFLDINVVVDKFYQVPLLLSDAMSFLLFIVIVEIVMRVLDFIANIFRKDGTEEIKKEMEN